MGQSDSDSGPLAIHHSRIIISGDNMNTIEETATTATTETGSIVANVLASVNTPESSVDIAPITPTLTDLNTGVQFEPDLRYDLAGGCGERWATDITGESHLVARTGYLDDAPDWNTLRDTYAAWRKSAGRD